MEIRTNSYMARKKLHKLSRYESKFFGWQVRPLCKVDNYSTAVKGSTKWDFVDCKKCLKFKDTK